jgi:hypothetical protein
MDPRVAVWEREESNYVVNMSFDFHFSREHKNENLFESICRQKKIYRLYFLLTINMKSNCIKVVTILRLIIFNVERSANSWPNLSVICD